MTARTKDRVAMNVQAEAMAAKSLIEALSTDDDALCHDMIEGSTGLFEAIESAIAEIDECEVIRAGCAEREDAYRRRREKFSARAERLRGLIEQAMVIAELQTARLPCATLTVKTLPPKPIYEDESAIPAPFWRQPDPVLDKKKIADAIKAGEEIPGVTKSNGTTSLTIRRI